MAVYDRLRDELLTDPLLGEQPAFARDYLKEVREKEREGWKNDALGPQKPTFPTHPTQMIDYNVPGGKLNRGMAVADALAALRSTTVEALPTDDRFKADVAGWCIEWLQAFFLVADDIMDNSSRGGGSRAGTGSRLLVCWRAMTTSCWSPASTAFSPATLGPPLTTPACWTCSMTPLTRRRTGSSWT